MENGTEALRVSAAEWSLAGDRQLLDLLQTIHQKIMTKCHETNNQLEQMVTDLDNASVSLQNVNNKFMALSNSQFIESRVYEDDADVYIEPPSDKQPPAQPNDIQSELSSLAAGLRRFEALHEAVSLLGGSDSDSGSDADSDEGESVILRPKNMYPDRPLPYIIGSNDWRTKWHAGLITEDSDTDSEISKPDHKEQALYSESESEAEPRPDKLAVPRAYEGSTTSSERSEDTRQTTNLETSHRNIETSAPSQADIAAELARRLGGGTEVPSRSEKEVDIPQPTQRKVYKPHQPSAGTVFCDEPPPLDPSSSEDDDIFAEINKIAPYTSTNRAHSRGNSLGADRVDIFDDLPGVEASGNIKPPAQPAKQIATLFGDDEDSDLFENKAPPPSAKPTDAEPVKFAGKKPVGAISVFGNSKGAESIGAAILKRNQRKSSSSDEESILNIDKKEKTLEEKDIFDDLFAKSDKTLKQPIQKKNESKVISKMVEEDIKKVDLFSDDIFDDIDDIFASNIPKVPVKDVAKSASKVKSIFDDDYDDDELFADIVVNKSDVNDDKSDIKAKILFDSGDELFSEKTEKAKVETVKKVALKPSVKANIYQIDEKAKQSSKGLFDSNEELFSKKNYEGTKNRNNGTKPTSVESKSIKKDDKTKGIFDDLFSSNKPFIDSSSTKQQKSEPFFEDETESDDTSDKNTKNVKIKSNSGDKISSSKTEETPHIEHQKQQHDTLVDKEKLEDTRKSTTLHSKIDFVSESKSQFKSPSLLWEDEQDDLFKQIKSKDTSPETKENVDNLDNIIKPSTAYLEPENGSNILKTPNVDNKSDEDKISCQTKIINSPDILGSDDDDDMGNDFFSKIKKPRDLSTNLKDGMSSNLQSYSNVNKPEILSKTDAASDISRVEDNNINELKGSSYETDNQSLQDTIKILDNEQTNLDGNKNVEKGTVLTTVKNTVSNEEKTGIVPDIFEDLPPAFEKPKEPKRSKNINALFDDDSDDEALFLRKEDNISDEKPTDVVNCNKEPIFALFHDEPPAIEVDFETNTSLTIKPTKSIETLTKNNENFQKKLKSTKQETPDNIDGIAQSKKEESKLIGKLKPMNFNINVNTLLPGASPKKTNNPKNNTPESPPESQEVVSKLVKTASLDSDAPILNTKISKERAKIQVKRRPSTRKARIEAVRKSAIDFGDDVDGNEKLNDDTNDNISSPSPQPDSIETVSKVSEPKKAEILKVNTGDVPNTNDIAIPKEVNTQVLAINDDDVYIFRDPNIQAKTANDPEVLENNADVIQDKEGIKTLGQEYEVSKVDPKSKQLNIIDDDDDDDDLFKIAAKSTTMNTQPVVTSCKQASIFGDDEDDDGSDIFKTKKHKCETVIESYDIANKPSKASLFDDSDDDDIFKKNSDSTANVSESSKSEQKPLQSSKSEAISIVDNDDIFKGMTTNYKQSDQSKVVNTKPQDDDTFKNNEDSKNIASSSTNMNKDPEEIQDVLKNTEKSTIFDDLSDDELFGGKKKALDSDEELFSSKRKPSLKGDVKKPINKVEVKKSLFGDDDDINIFGANPKSAAKSTKPLKPAKESTKTTEPVFDDPLSMFNDDDDY